MNTQRLIETLQLEPHPLEGGYYKRTYQSQLSVATKTGERSLMSSIYYLLTQEQPIGYFHRNRSDIVHYYHLGGAIAYWLVSPDGAVERRVMGSDLAAGQDLQLTVPGGYWKASELNSGEFALISEAVAPGF